MERKCPLSSHDQPLAVYDEFMDNGEADLLRRLPESAKARYKDFRHLGAGGKGFVYSAYDSELDREIALKLIKPALAQNKREARRFKREIQTAAQICHPNVVELFDFTHEGDTLFFTMELLTGTTLKELFVKEQLSVGKIVELLRQVAAGVSAMHEVDLCHRDLKPGNVLVTEDGLAKLIDFGAVKHSLPGKLTTLTKTGHVIGTIVYQPPEAFSASGYEKRSDVYQMGLLLYEALASRHPLEAFPVREIVRGEALTKVKALSELNEDVDEALQAIVEKAMAFKVEDRYESADALANELSAWLLQHEFSITTTTPVEKQTPDIAIECEKDGDQWASLLLVAFLLVLIPYLLPQKSSREIPLPSVSPMAIATKPQQLQSSDEKKFNELSSKFGLAFKEGNKREMGLLIERLRLLPPRGERQNSILHVAEAASAWSINDTVRMLNRLALVQRPDEIEFLYRDDVFTKTPLLSLAIANRKRLKEREFGKAMASLLVLGASKEERLLLALKVADQFLKPFYLIDEPNVQGSEKGIEALVSNLTSKKHDDSTKTYAALGHYSLFGAFIDSVVFFYGFRQKRYAEMRHFLDFVNESYFRTWEKDKYRTMMVKINDWTLDALDRTKEPRVDVKDLYDTLLFWNELHSKRKPNRPYPYALSELNTGFDKTYFRSCANFQWAQGALLGKWRTRQRLLKDFSGTVQFFGPLAKDNGDIEKQREAQLLLARSLCCLAQLTKSKTVFRRGIALMEKLSACDCPFMRTRAGRHFKFWQERQPSQ